MNSVKKIYIDTETTGTDPERHGIIQLAGIVEINETKMQSFDYKIRPFPNDVLNEKALEVTGHTLEDMELIKTSGLCKTRTAYYESPSLVYLSFKSLLASYVDKFNKRDKFHIIGYNSRFDDGFLRAWFKKNDDSPYAYGSYFWWPAIDVSNIAAEIYMENRKEFENFKLATVAAVSGITIDKGRTHDALYDVEITKELYNNLKRGQNEQE